MITNSKRLNLGCGRNILTDWINVDVVPLEGVDVITDLDDCEQKKLPFADNEIDEFFASHVIEHLHNPLPFMEELHRIAKQNAKATFRVPYGSSDDAFEDPTHVRQYFLKSFGFFSQPFYFKADYGYRGDWLTEKIILLVDAHVHQGKNAEQIMFEINTFRNIVKEMIVELRAIKPIREAKAELIVSPPIEISLI
ncbi:class I SAM-dependent methyltransferase [Limnofasciculus baicalensis]|uniref:Methyltransferase domain-containing protein n=1 Tax=Limnofasciculus baicalensis BBK-W-15 TaxID=2699891 RepID=A0AAE3KMZ5_9CYAN|nr:methyltransferase domain-containing protein [Limnofasciculus baicalensis]MCP2729301.1 methyltransferase domain-containing protein [Limnofasciculus baicalensis BBK-W-15]